MKRGDDVALPPQTCPLCGHQWNRAGTLENSRQPRAGDYTMCINCGQVTTFDENMNAVPLNEADVKRLAQQPALQKSLAHVQLAWRRMKARLS